MSEAWERHVQALAAMRSVGSVAGELIVRWSMADLARVVGDEELLQLSQLATAFLHLHRPVPASILERLDTPQPLPAGP